MSTHEERIADLERRLVDQAEVVETLCRQRRTVRKWAAGMLAVLALASWGVLQSGAQTPSPKTPNKPQATPAATTKTPEKVIRATRFEVVDVKGRILASLGAGEKTGLLEIRNQEGKTIAKIGPGRNNDGAITTFSHKGKVLIHLGSTSGQDGSISTFNPDGLELVNLGAATNGSGAVLTYDANGHQMTVLTGLSDGGLIGAYNDGGSLVVRIGVKDEGAGVIEVTGVDGSVKALDPSNPDEP